ncbi:Thioredoxin H-type [Entamoeba marina]
MTNYIEVTTLEDLQKAHESGVVIVQFHTTWCSDCINIKPLYSQLRKKSPHISFVDVDVSKSSSLRTPYGVKHVPTFVLYQNNKEVNRISEPTYEALEEFMEKASQLK